MPDQRHLPPPVADECSTDARIATALAILAMLFAAAACAVELHWPNGSSTIIGQPITLPADDADQQPPAAPGQLGAGDELGTVLHADD